MMEIVAEVGPCNGHLDSAFRYVDACAELGMTMKVQWYDRDRLTSRTAPRYDKTDDRHITQHEMFENVLDWDDWGQVFEYAKNCEVPIFPTVFDIESVMMAQAMGVKRLKIASADITYLDLIAPAGRVSEQVIISTGGAKPDEVATAMREALQENDVLPLACHLAYPSKLEEAHIGRMLYLRDTYGRAGYSDHVKGDEIGHLPLLVAAGATMWERHFTLTPGAGGDHNMAISPVGMLKAMISISLAEEIIGDRELQPTDHEQEAIRFARRSLHAARDIPKGTRITRDMLKVVRPGTGIPPHEIDKLTAKGGMLAMVDIAEDTTLTWPMVGLVGASLSVE